MGRLEKPGTARLFYPRPKGLRPHHTHKFLEKFDEGCPDGESHCENCEMCVGERDARKACKGWV